MEEMKKIYKNDDGEWALYPFVVRYTQDGTTYEQLTDSPEWYKAFAGQWVDFTVDEIVAQIYDDDQIERLAEIQGMQVKDYDELSDYVLNGIVNVNSKIFTIKTIVELDKNMTQTELALVEIYEVMGV